MLAPAGKSYILYNDQSKFFIRHKAVKKTKGLLLPDIFDIFRRALPDCTISFNSSFSELQ